MKLTLKTPLFNFIVMWLAIWGLGTLIIYKIYDISAGLWFEGIKALPIGLAIWWLLERFVFRQHLDRLMATKNRAVALSALLYWPCLQLVIMYTYGRI
jgi:hypothetical protein